MASRTAIVASSIVAGVLAGAPVTMPRDIANAAECLTEPGKDGTQGQHWYFRIEHGTQRHCWYLRDPDGKAVDAASSDVSEQAPKAAAPKGDNPPRALEDARAEYPMPQPGGIKVGAPAVGPVPFASTTVAPRPQADPQAPAAAALWPSAENAAAPAAPAQASPAAAPTPRAAADATDATTTAADPPADPPASAPAVIPAPPAKPSVSLQMLFAVIGGALALAGLTASVVYRLGRRRERRLATPERRAILWEGVEPGAKSPWSGPIPDDSAPLPLPERKIAQGAVAPERYEKMEEILEQLVRQGQQTGA